MPAKNRPPSRDPYAPGARLRSVRSGAERDRYRWHSHLDDFVWFARSSLPVMAGWTIGRTIPDPCDPSGAVELVHDGSHGRRYVATVPAATIIAAADAIGALPVRGPRSPAVDRALAERTATPGELAREAARIRDHKDR